MIVKLYNRVDCQLCEEAISLLNEIQSEVPHQLEIIDVDQSNDLKKQYGEYVPVVEVGPYKLKAPFDRKELLITLNAAQRGIQQNKAIDNLIADAAIQQSPTWTKADGISYWLSKNYLILINIFVLIYVGGAFLAPVFMEQGVEGPANALYKVYSAVCHQLAFRSWFLFGEQLAYPREVARVTGLATYEQATGMNSLDFVAARNFLGNEIVGYKIALCQRDVAIYLSILLFGIVYSLSKRRLPALPAGIWLLMAIAPIGLDGFSQLISQLPFNLLPYRESTPLLRTVTGFLFGFGTAWFGIPMVEATMVETRNFYTIKLRRLRGELTPEV
jgi:uncharacterized membrane protein